MKYLLIILCCFISGLMSCSNEKSYDINASNKYEKGKFSLEEVEKKNPKQFLRVNGSSKKNLLRQTVIKGNVYNNAKIVSYKDISIKLKFYSKTGALLEEDIDVVYESINPGGSYTFKSKYFAPKGTDSVGMTVIDAKF